MSFPRYPAYKDSGVEWLGNVPVEWDVFPLKRKARLLTEKTESSDNPVALENIEGWSGRWIETDTKFEGEGVAFQVGDILFGKLRPYLAKVYLADRDGEAVGDFHVLDPDPAVCPRLLQYQLLTKEIIDLINSSTYGAKMPRASWQFLGAMELPLPPLCEQVSIVNFLDHETAKIDALIAEQQRLIELLQEKRQAVISHAVTKGLNPAIPMKDSGVEWLGEVPEHWALLKLKHVASFSGGGTPSRENLAFWNGDIPWVSPKDMKVERIADSEETITEIGLQNSSSKLQAAFQVLMVVRSGILQHTIPVAINEVPVALNQDMKAIDFGRHRVISEFFLRWVQGLNNLLLLAWAKQGATVESIEQSYLAETIIAMPDLLESAGIIKYLEVELVKFDSLASNAHRAINLLQERRSALISAAVTGQIDVRGLVPEAVAV